MNATKENIILKSLSLFLQKSYKEVTMREILEATRLSKGAFYHHFKSKEELFEEIVTLFFKQGVRDYSILSKDSLKDFIEEYLLQTEQSFEQLKLFLGGEEGQEISFNFFFIMFDAMKRFPKFLEMEVEQYRRDRSVWESVIENAKSSGEIKSETSSKELADLFLYCTDGVFIRVLNNDKQSKYAHQLKEAFTSIYDNLRS